MQYGDDEQIKYEQLVADQHDLQKLTTIGRSVDVTVTFDTPFSENPKVLITTYRVDIDEGFPLSYDIKLKSVSTTQFVYEAIALTDKPINSLFVRWMAIVDFNIEIKYAHSYTAKDNIPFVMDNELNCKTGVGYVGTGFTIGGTFQNNPHEFRLEMGTISSDRVVVHADPTSGSSSNISFVVVIACADSMEVFNFVTTPTTPLQTGTNNRCETVSDNITNTDITDEGIVFFGGIQGYLSNNSDISGTRLRFDVNVAGTQINTEICTWGQANLDSVNISLFTFRQAQCNAVCNTCAVNPENCTSCIDPNRQGSDCRCIPGWYQYGQTATCLQCETQCYMCQHEANLCERCAVAYGRSDNTPTCGCQVGFYEIANQLDCGKCSSQCSECTEIDSCTACLNTNFYPPDCNSTINPTVPVCSYKCETCGELDQNDCTKCSGSNNRSEVFPECACLIGYHDNNGENYHCVACQPQCLTCADDFSCLTCDSDKNLEIDQFTNICACKEGYIWSNKSNSCQKCSYYWNECFVECPPLTKEDSSTGQCTVLEYETTNNFSVLVILGASVTFIFFCSAIILQASVKNGLSNIFDMLVERRKRKFKKNRRQTAPL